MEVIDTSRSGRKGRKQEKDTRFLNDPFTDIACKEVPAIPSADKLKQTSKLRPSKLSVCDCDGDRVCAGGSYSFISLMEATVKRKTRGKVNNSQILFN